MWEPQVRMRIITAEMFRGEGLGVVIRTGFWEEGTGLDLNIDGICTARVLRGQKGHRKESSASPTFWGPLYHFCRFPVPPALLFT